MVNLKATITENGTILVPATAGEYIIQIAGTWGGATVTVGWDYDGGNVTYTDGAFTADGGAVFSIASGKFSLVTTGSGTTSLKVFISPVVTKTKSIV
jgi:hypothetical protein